MIADDLIKALITAKHEAFVKTTSLEDQEKHLAFVRKEKDRENAI